MEIPGQDERETHAAVGSADEGTSAPKEKSWELSFSVDCDPEPNVTSVRICFGLKQHVSASGLGAASNVCCPHSSNHLTGSALGSHCLSQPAPSGGV